jgi:hypothetical protein
MSEWNATANGQKGHVIQYTCIRQTLRCGELKPDPLIGNALYCQGLPGISGDRKDRSACYGLSLAKNKETRCGDTEQVSVSFCLWTHRARTWRGSDA